MQESPSNDPRGAAATDVEPDDVMRATARVHFDKWARSYDTSKLNALVFFPTIRACQEEILRWQKLRGEGPFRLLDVGCGTGWLLALTASWPTAERLVGLDASPEMLTKLEAKIAAAPDPTKLQAVHGDAEHLPFEDGSFDVLTCCNSFHHYPNQAGAIREFHRVLRPGGLLILVDGFRDNVVGWFVFDVGVASVERDVYHAPWSEVRDMINAAGFASLRQRKLNVLAPLLVSIARR